jgi:hypothetical protein
MKITIPDNWNGVTVEQFCKLGKLDAEQQIAEVISILSGEQLEEIEKLDTQAIGQILSNMTWFFELPPEDKYNKVIEIEGKEYSLMNMSDFSIREWIDLSILMSDKFENLAKIFSILYKSEGKRCDHELMKKAPIGLLYGTLVFFCRIEKKYYDHLPTYLIQKMMKMKSQKTKQKASWHGMTSFTRWLRGISSGLQKYTKKT